MDNAILNRIRNILMVYRDTKQGDNEGPYGWGDLVAQINEHHSNRTGIELGFPRNSLENCVRGLEHPDQDKQKLGMRKYSKPKPERLQAMVRFLTDEDSDGYFCTKEELYSLPEKKPPVFLLNYLHNGESPDHYFSAKFLFGRFKHTHEETENSTLLKFLNSTSNSLITLEIHKNNLSVDTKGDPYIGWGVITPEENLIIMAQHIRSNENLMYLSVGIDNRIYQMAASGAVNAFVLLEHEYPMDEVAVKSPFDRQVMLERAKDLLEQQIRLFERVEADN